MYDFLAYGSGGPSRGKRAVRDAEDLTLMDDEDLFHGGGES